MLKSYTNKRVKFLNKSEQKEFMSSIMQKTGNKTRDVALIGKVSIRQVSDWKNAKSTLPLNLFERLLKMTKTPRPKRIEVLGRYAHTKAAGKKGFYATLKKYGKMPINEEIRRENWQKWWNSTGVNKKQIMLERIAIRIPMRNSDLAELCGILIGDGGVTKWQVIITLNCETDQEYSQFVADLLKKLFNTEPKIYRVKNSKAINICISRRDLVDFLNGQGILIGHKLKQNLSIPEWIIESEKYLIPCIRGMFDTDGCVVRETHFIKGKKYVYYRLNFTSASPILIKQTIDTLIKIGFHPKIRRGGQSVQLENLAEICEYFKRVGTHNPKHLKRLGGVG